ncbi:MAG: DUF3631 domain-containing protein [Alphaproteobacteria bacterium]
MNNFFKPIDVSKTNILTKEPEVIPIIPVPDNAPEPSFKITEWNEPKSVYAYKNAKNELVGYIARYETVNGSTQKTFRPFTYCKLANGKTAWQMKGLPEPRPLYGEEFLEQRPNDNILIVEGEKTADNARLLFPDYLVLTWAGGANAISKANWSILQNSKIKLWADNDEAGKQAILKLFRILKKQNEVAIVKIPEDFPEGWDLADELPKDKSISFLRTLLETSSKTDSKQLAGRELNLPRPNPYSKPVNGKELLDELRAIFKKYLVLPDNAETSLALWVLFTYSFDAFEHSPRLLIHSPEKRCGKTTLLMLLDFLCCKSLRVSSLTASAMFRTIEEYAPTLLIDEVDAFLKEKEELRGIINEGHTKGGGVIRNVEVSKGHSVRFFNVFCPCAIAGIGKLADTIADRSLIITMRRKFTGETVERLRGDKSSLFDIIKQKCSRFADDNYLKLQEADPIISNQINDRSADNWRPLLAIAELAGKKWLEQANIAMNTTDSIGYADDDSSIKTLLLSDIRDIFKDYPLSFISSQELCLKLADICESPWSEWKNYQPITPLQLSVVLKDFGIKSHQKRMNDKNLKCYHKEHFKDAFSRYLIKPSTPLQHSKTNTYNHNQPSTNPLPDKNIYLEKAKDSKSCRYVEGRNFNHSSLGESQND